MRQLLRNSWGAVRQRTAELGRLIERRDATDELELIRAVRAGDVGAFQEIWNRYRNRIFALCLRLTANGSDAEDLTQVAFETMLKKIDTLQDDAKFSSWFFTMTSRLALSHLRKSKRLVLSETDEALTSCIEATDVARAPTAAELLDLQRAVERLPQGYRLVFTLHHAGLSHQEIAAELGITESTSRTQLHKARRMLMAQLVLEPPCGGSQ